MIARQRFEGETIAYKNETATKISYGDVVDLGSRIAIAACDIAPGETGTVDTENVYELPADNTAAMDMGQEVFWDGAKVVATAGDNTRAGWVTEKKLLAGTTVSVKIN